MHSTTSPNLVAAEAAFRALTLDEQSRFLLHRNTEANLRVADARLGRIAGGRAHWRRLHGLPYAGHDPLPGDDHVEYRAKGRLGTYVSKSYGIGLTTMRAIVATCDEKDLTCVVGPGGWHAYGETMTIEYTRRSPIPAASNHKARPRP